MKNTQNNSSVQSSYEEKCDKDVMMYIDFAIAILTFATIAVVLSAFGLCIY